MAKGQLVPDSVVIEMLDKLFDQHPDNVGYIFDGFQELYLKEKL